MAAQYTEYVVKLGNVEDKEFNIMRFKPPHKCDIEKLNNPKLERQEVKVNEKIEQEDDGSEYRHKEREEARRRKRGFRPRKTNPADQPWILRESKKGGKHFIGRKEGTFNSSASYYVMALGNDNSFEAYPVSNWYDFVPPVKYNYLNDEEAEERFEKRNKTLNYFSIMVSKRIKEKEESNEATTGTQNSDSDGEFSSVGSDRESSSPKKKTKSKKQKPKKAAATDSEAGEETDEGDIESQEMDYFSSSSSEGEERKLKEVKEQPRDDAEVERKEKGGVDEVFVDRSSSSEDELTESGKQLKALIHKQSHGGESETEEDKEEGDAGQSNSKGIKREGSPLANVSTKKPKLEVVKVEPTADTITKEEVVKYLSRKPLTSRALMKKFIKLKPAMTKDAITTMLAKIVKSIPDNQLHSEEINHKKYLSIKTV